MAESGWSSGELEVGAEEGLGVVGWRVKLRASRPVNKPHSTSALYSTTFKSHEIQRAYLRRVGKPW